MNSIIFLSEIAASFQKTAEKMVAVCASMFRDYFLTWSMVNVTTRVNPLHMHSPLITKNQTQILYWLFKKLLHFILYYISIHLFIVYLI